MKKHINYFLSLLVTFTVVSCSDFQLPETISIKTNANYNFTVASVEKSFSEFISSETLQKSFNTEGSATKFKLYDYNPGDYSLAQQYLAEINLQEIPIDIASYFSSMDFSTSLASLSFNQSISVPDISTTNYSQKIALPDINQKIRSETQINVNSVPIPQGINTALPEAIPVVINISQPGFTSISFHKGNLILNASTLDTVPANFSTTIKAQLINGLDNSVISTSQEVTIRENGTLILPLTNKIIYPAMKLLISGSSTGGVLGQFTSYTITATLSDECTISRATGLNLTMNSDDAININENILIQTDPSFVSCLIDSGSLSIKSNYPTNWTGIKFTPNFNITGGINATENSFDKTKEVAPFILNRTLDLKDKVYSGGNLNLQGSVSIALENANIILDSETTPEVNIDINCNIAKIKSITVDLEKNANFEQSKDIFSFTKTEPLPESVKQYVDSMTLTKAGIKLVYSNTLPEGNDITLNANSSFFALSKQETLKSNSLDAVLDFTNSTENTISTSNDIDFNVNLSLPGATTEHPYYAVLSNIEFGKEYTISIQAEPIFDWKDVTIKTQALSLSDTVQTNFNIASMFNGLTEQLGDNNFINNIKFSSLPLYLFCSKPSLQVLDDIDFMGTIKLKKGVEETSLIDNQKISFQNLVPLTITENNTVTTNLDTIPATVKTDICNFINLDTTSNTEENFSIFYDLQLQSANTENTITITKADFDSLGTSQPTSIAITARIVLPLEILVTNDTDLDLLKIINKNKEEASNQDLFNRTEATTLGDVEKYINAIEYLNLIYKADNNLLKYQDKTKNIQVLFDTKNTSLTNPSYTLNINKDNVKIYTSDVTQILQQYPFNPDVKFLLPQGTLYVPRDAKIKINLSLGIKTNGAIPIFEANKS